VRLTLNDDEVTKLLNIIQSIDTELYNVVNTQYIADKSKDKSRKQLSIKEATRTRERIAKEKINNAINLLRLEDKPLTVYQIAKKSGCSYNTVKKYYKAGTDATDER